MKIYFFSRRYLKVFLIVILLLCTVPFYSRLFEEIKEVVVMISGRLIPIYYVGTETKKVAFSFDATWGTENTAKLLDILDKHKVKTTFFLAGNWLQNYPDMVKEINRRGHELGNHSWTHPHMNSLSKDQIIEEITLTHDKLKELIGKKPTLFRPPFGEYSNKVIEGAEQCGYKTIMWSIDSLDWKELTAEQMIARVLKKLHPGAIILFHNAGIGTPQAIDELFTLLEKDGYQVVPISGILVQGPYYTDYSGKMLPKPVPADPLKAKEEEKH